MGGAEQRFTGQHDLLVLNNRIELISLRIFWVRRDLTLLTQISLIGSADGDVISFGSEDFDAGELGAQIS